MALPLKDYLRARKLSPARFGAECNPPISRQAVENRIQAGWVVGWVDGVFCNYHPLDVCPCKPINVPDSTRLRSLVVAGTELCLEIDEQTFHELCKHYDVKVIINDHN